MQIYLDRLRILAREKYNEIMKVYQSRRTTSAKSCASSKSGASVPRGSGTTGGQRMSSVIYQEKLNEIEESIKEKELLKRRTDALIKALNTTNTEQKLDFLTPSYTNNYARAIAPNLY